MKWDTDSGSKSRLTYIKFQLQIIFSMWYIEDDDVDYSVRSMIFGF
jgi:hypothetical protein